MNTQQDKLSKIVDILIKQGYLPKISDENTDEVYQILNKGRDILTISINKYNENENKHN